MKTVSRKDVGNPMMIRSFKFIKAVISFIEMMLYIIR